MAHYLPSAGFDHFTGALSKRKNQSRLCVTRCKSVKDPLTGEVVGFGQKEIYAQEPRDYKKHPLTPKEQAQRTKWREACSEAVAITRDKSHPRYRELYLLWRSQLPTASTHPTTASTQPTTASTRPATASTQPTTASTQPTTASTRPTTASTQPTTNTSIQSSATPCMQFPNFVRAILVREQNSE